MKSCRRLGARSTVICLSFCLLGASSLGYASERGKPFGLFRYAATDARHVGLADFTRVSPGEAAAASDRGLNVVIGLAGGRSRYSDADGCFSIEKWKQSSHKSATSEIRSLVSHGTVIGVYALDEPHDWDCGPTFEEIDRVCGYTHELLGPVKCGVNAPPDWLKKGLIETDFGEVDFLVSQYNFKRGPEDLWITETLAAADWFSGEIWLSVNVITGSPSAEDISRVGHKLCNSDADAVMMWKWDSRIAKSQNLVDAIRSVRSACGSAVGDESQH